MNKLVKVVCCMLIVSAPSISAAGFRYENGKLAQEGDTTAEVQADCGRPLSKESVGRVKVNGTTVNLDRWTYDLGEGKFLKLLEFHDGILVDVNDGLRQ